MDACPARKLKSLESDIGKVLLPIFAECKTDESIAAFVAVTKNVSELKKILEKEKKP